MSPADPQGTSPSPGSARIELRTAFDHRWGLATILLAYCLASVPLQRQLWAIQAACGPQNRTLVLGSFVAALGALALSTYLMPTASAAVANSLSSWLSPRRRVAWMLLVALAALIPGLVAWGVLDRFPNSGDEYAYLFQARQFASGHLWARAPALGDTFVAFRTWVIDGKWVSQYPPGWPAALTAALVAGVPVWSLNALLGAGGVATLASPLWNFKDRELVLAGIALFVLSAFYLFNAASLFPHVFAALLILLVCMTCLWYQRGHQPIALVTCGMLLGLIGMSRYFSLVLLLPALAYWMFVENRDHRLRMFALITLGGLPFLACLMTYQYWITGSPFKDTYSLITTHDVFVSAKPRDLIHGTWLTAVRLAELSVWACPLVLPVYALCLWAKAKSRRLVFYDLVFPGFVVGFLFFADNGGNRYGPRYYFEAVPLLLVTILSAVPALESLTKGRTVRALVLNTVAISTAYVLTALPFAFRDYHAQVVMREQPYRLAAAHRLENAIVLIDTPSGLGLVREDLARNDVDLSGPVLYARPGVPLSDLRQAFPQRSIWRYRRETGGFEDLQRVSTPVTRR